MAITATALHGEESDSNNIRVCMALYGVTGPSERTLASLKALEDASILLPNSSITHFPSMVQASWRPEKTRDVTYGDRYRVAVENGVVKYRILGLWMSQPKESWAWRFTMNHDDTRIWVPEPISPSIWIPIHWDHIVSILSPSSPPDDVNLSASRMVYSCPIPFFQFLSKSRDGRSLRMCRLVCRDWARHCPLITFTDLLCSRLSQLELCRLEFDGILADCWLVMLEPYLPNTMWAWVFQRTGREGDWTKMLSQSTITAAHWTEIRSNYMTKPPRVKKSSSASKTDIAHNIPPELFQYICDTADNGSWSLRLVSRYWNTQCSRHMFASVDVRNSPAHVRDLWRFHKGSLCQFMQQVETIENVPSSSCDLKFPWLHLLTQTCHPNEIVWNHSSDFRSTKGPSTITVWGPSVGGHRTIRSVHFALPRSPLPRSFSYGIRRLILSTVHFASFQDLTHLACELSDLQELGCYSSTFDSFSLELPRRRPRTNLNKLRSFEILVYRDRARYPMCHLALGAFNTFLSAYSAASFLSEHGVTVVEALLRILQAPAVSLEARSRQNHEDRSQIFELKTSTPDDMLVSLRTPQDADRTYIDLKVAIACAGADHEWLAEWGQLDSTINTISPLIRRARFIFGFRGQIAMNRFAEDVPSKIPSISRIATIRYSLRGTNGGWCRALPGSGVLQAGESTSHLADIYA